MNPIRYWKTYFNCMRINEKKHIQIGRMYFRFKSEILVYKLIY